MNRLRQLVAVLHFLTRLRITKKISTWEDVAGGLWAFPFVGFVIGTILSLASVPVCLFSPAALRGAIILVIWVWITGALHVDGYIDSCDGLLAQKTARERLAIMKDVSAGSFGVAGAILLFIIKYGALTSIDPGALLVVLPLATVTGRAAMTYVMYRFPYARKTGMGKEFKDRVGLKDVLISLAVLVPISATFFFLSYPAYLGIAASAVTVLFLELFGFWVLKRIPGFTGDVYGAACELAEAIVLVWAAVMLRGFR